MNRQNSQSAVSTLLVGLLSLNIREFAQRSIIIEPVNEADETKATMHLSSIIYKMSRQMNMKAVG